MTTERPRVQKRQDDIKRYDQVELFKKVTEADMRAARVGDLASIFKKDTESRQKPYKEVKSSKESKHDKAAKKSKKKVKRPKFNNAFDDKGEGSGSELPDMNADPRSRHRHKKNKGQDVLDIHSEA